MKRAISVLLALCMLVSLVACGGGAAPASSTAVNAPKAADSRAATAAPATSQAQTTSGKHVKNIVIGTTKAFGSMSIRPAKGSGALWTISYNGVLSANFFYEDGEGNIKPYFFEDYKLSDDATQLSLTVPTDKIWHDGMPVTVDDVVFTFEFMRDYWKVAALKNLADISVDGNVVTLTFSRPDAFYFLKSSSTITTYMLPKHIWGKLKEEEYATFVGDQALIGCGPYKVVSYDLETGVMEFEVVPQNNYLGELTVDSITLKTYLNQDALLMALANGEIDVMFEYASPINYTLLDLIANNKDVDPGMSEYRGVNQVTFGMDHGPNQTREFREAAIKSLNWPLITQLCNGEYGEIPGSGILPRASIGFDDSYWKLYQNVDEANQLLDKAGFLDKDGDGFREMPDGTAFTYKITSQLDKSRNEMFARIGEVISQSLKGIGVNAYYDTESLASDEINAKMITDSDYDMFIGLTTSGMAYQTCFWYFVPRSVAGSGGKDWGGSYNDPDLNAAYKKLQTAVNSDEYISAVKGLQKLGSEDLFAFALCWEKCFFPYRIDKYQGFNNYDSWGVVNAETWYTLTTK